MSENILDANTIKTPGAVVADTQGQKDTEETKPKDPRFFWLTVAQYLVLGIVGLAFVYILFYGFLGSDGKNLEQLAKPEVARGVITYLIAVATVGIATVLAMAAILSGGKDLGQRFALGKEILTLLIGVLGTIIGFYYGSSTKESPTAKTAVAAVAVAPVKLSTETPQIGKTFALDTTITGGTAPYTYTIKFDPNVVAPAVSGEVSKDGKIHHEFKVSETATAETPVNFVIEAKDAAGETLTYNKEGKQKLTLKAP
jgi:hypothetical protein